MVGLVVCVGCATFDERAYTSSRDTYATPSIVVVKRIPDIQQPAWTKSMKDYWLEENNVYAYASIDDSPDYNIAILNAENKAKAKLEKGGKEMMRTEFETAMGTQKYDITLGGMVKESFADIVKNKLIKMIK